MRSFRCTRRTAAACAAASATFRRLGHRGKRGTRRRRRHDPRSALRAGAARGTRRARDRGLAPRQAVSDSPRGRGRGTPWPDPRNRPCARPAAAAGAGDVGLGPSGVSRTNSAQGGPAARRLEACGREAARVRGDALLAAVQLERKALAHDGAVGRNHHRGDERVAPRAALEAQVPPDELGAVLLLADAQQGIGREVEEGAGDRALRPGRGDRRRIRLGPHQKRRRCRCAGRACLSATRFRVGDDPPPHGVA